MKGKNNTFEIYNPYLNFIYFPDFYEWYIVGKKKTLKNSTTIMKKKERVQLL